MDMNKNIYIYHYEIRRYSVGCLEREFLKYYFIELHVILQQYEWMRIFTFRATACH